jgi:hypothetical protein
MSTPTPVSVPAPALQLDSAIVAPERVHQQAQQKHILRTPSPRTPLPSTPPPTNRPLIHQHTSSHVQVSDLPTTEQISMASVEDLRLMVAHLNVAVREARTAAAHFKLQHNMLILDSEKASERMAVELEMTQREVEVLQEAEERRRADYMGPVQATANAVVISDLNRHCQLLQSENEEFRDVLGRAARDIEDRDGQIMSLREENQRLRHRIKQNREHMNGLLDSVSDGSPRSIMATPHRTPHQHTTPRHLTSARTTQMMPSSQGREPGAFEALLLADKVLNSQETATAPSTPRTQPLKHKLGHTRNTHSLSSLPSTPSRRPLHTSTALRTPPHLTSIMEPPPVSQPLPPHFALTAGTTRRRASSDSTITASSIDEREDQMSGSDDDAIPESQASQAATSMLRRTPNSSQQSKGRLTQSKILGKVTKPVAVARVADAEKRRLASYGTGTGAQQGSPSKKTRVEGDGVGLGIGIVPGRDD